MGVRPILTDPSTVATFSRDSSVQRNERRQTMATVIGPERRQGGLPRQHRGAVHDRRRRTPAGDFSLVEHPLLPASAGGAAAPAHPRGRVQLRARGPDGRRCSATRWSRPAPATWSSSRATSGTPSGTPARSPARILEIIAPAGFEHFFEELVDMGGVAQGRPGAAGGALRPLRARDATGDRPGAARALRSASASRWALQLASPQLAVGPAGRLRCYPAAGRQSACASVSLTARKARL